MTAQSLGYLFLGLRDLNAASRIAQHRHSGRSSPDGRRDADVDETATLAGGLINTSPGAGEGVGLSTFRNTSAPLALLSLNQGQQPTRDVVAQHNEGAEAADENGGSACTTR